MDVSVAIPMEKESISSINVRAAIPQDIPFLLQCRELMFRDMGYNQEDLLKQVIHASEEYMNSHIYKHDFFAWIAESKNVKSKKEELLGTGALIIDHHIPSPRNPMGYLGYIFNLAVLPHIRRKGIATKILHVILDWCVTRNIGIVTLHSSEMGYSLYQKMGFKSDEYYLTLDPRTYQH